jgi:hypothetical protein
MSGGNMQRNLQLRYSSRSLKEKHLTASVKIKVAKIQVLVVHAYNPSYPGGRD